VTDIEVITTALIAALYFGGDIEHARRFRRGAGLMLRLPSRSRLCRWDEPWRAFFQRQG
jgi:hypothetical protein